MSQWQSGASDHHHGGPGLTPDLAAFNISTKKTNLDIHKLQKSIKVK